MDNRVKDATLLFLWGLGLLIYCLTGVFLALALIMATRFTTAAWSGTGLLLWFWVLCFAFAGKDRS